MSRKIGIMENRLGGNVPLLYNYVRYQQVPMSIKRVDMSYYDSRFDKKRDPMFANEFLRILE